MPLGDQPRIGVSWMTGCKGTSLCEPESVVALRATGPKSLMRQANLFEMSVIPDPPEGASRRRNSSRPPAMPKKRRPLIVERITSANTPAGVWALVGVVAHSVQSGTRVAHGPLQRTAPGFGSAAGGQWPPKARMRLTLASKRCRRSCSSARPASSTALAASTTAA